MPKLKRYPEELKQRAVRLVLGAPQARAGMFDDDEARRQIKDLTLQLNERLDTVSKGQFELLNQIQALHEDNARLRGRVETLEYELDSAKKRQQDFYIDLDGHPAQPHVARALQELRSLCAFYKVLGTYPVSS